MLNLIKAPTFRNAGAVWYYNIINFKTKIMRCLFLFLVFLGSHTFQVNLLAVDPAFQYWPIAGNPKLVLGGDGEDMEVTFFITHTFEGIIIAAFIATPVDDAPKITIGEVRSEIIAIRLLGVLIYVVVS